ncbi:hypothetical protein Y032_0494g2457 [Ancylostoma ceylanicum]|uniref:Uncharacterized protein n=1 Tax=Ancylostoma ceylanicum TaxID=53326 RepID=A0A016WWL7_9BILA|nr:hypothetical protein Y032_0494g2457 [Ancylostoma ceylanicum]
MAKPVLIIPNSTKWEGTFSRVSNTWKNAWRTSEEKSILRRKMTIQSSLDMPIMTSLSAKTNFPDPYPIYLTVGKKAQRV